MGEVLMSVDSFCSVGNEANAFIKDFLLPESKRYVFGVNEFADSIANVVGINAYIDDFKNGYKRNGILVVSSNDVPKDALVVSCVVYGRPLTAKSVLAQKGLRNLDYFSFKKYSNLELEKIKFFDGFKEHFDSHRFFYENLVDVLSDDESRYVLRKLINFRLTSNLKYLRGFQNIQFKQYFEYFLNFDDDTRQKVFLDVGGFNGETTIEFFKNCGENSHVEFFEPDEKNYNISLGVLSNFNSITFHNKGVSNFTGEVGFSSAGSSSLIDESSEVKIKVSRIDDFNYPHVSYIKMDIEGMEVLALEGAKGTIMRCRPSLAICVYHSPDHIMKIFNQVKNYYDGYKVFLRHYTEGTTETVMYFIP